MWFTMVAMAGRGGSWWRGSWWRGLAVTGGVLGPAVALALVGAALRVRGLQYAANVAQLVSAVLALPPLAAALVRRGRPVPPGTADLARAKDVLAGLVAEQWRAEAIARALDDPDPMPVRWRLTEQRAVMDHRANVAAGPLRMSGVSDHVEALAERFRGLRRRRLVILGGPGSGKTTLAVQLLLCLLASRSEDEPVPVLISAASWDTETHPRLSEWLAVRLGQDYPALRAAALGADLPRILAARGHILPVLDGLDELPEAARTAVITALNSSLGDGQLILTSRTREFTDAVRAAGDVLTSAAVIQAQPLSPAAAAEYLRGALPPEPGPEWKRILADLDAPDGDGPAAVLAETVSSPLGLWLLRAAYLVPGTDPAPLREPGRFATPADLRAHLLDRLIPAVLTSRPPSKDPADLFRPRERHDPDQVRHWLGHLAYHLDRAGTRDFIWWHLARHTLPRRTLRVRAGLATGLTAGCTTALTLTVVLWLVYGAVTGLVNGPASGLVSGSVTGLIVGRKARSWREDAPGFADLKVAGRKAPLAHAARAGFAAGLRIGPPFGLLYGLVVCIAYQPWVGLWNGLLIGFAMTVTAAIAVGVTEWAETPTPADQASTPVSTWRADRALNLMRTVMSGLTAGLTLGVTFGLAFGLAHGLAYGIAYGLAIGLAIGPALGSHHAWAAYLVATRRLARQGRLPYRLMPFLDDAHRLGLLRTVGPIYQFRHADLQDHLAARHAETADVEEGTPSGPAALVLHRGCGTNSPR